MYKVVIQTCMSVNLGCVMKVFVCDVCMTSAGVLLHCSIRGKQIILLKYWTYPTTKGDDVTLLWPPLVKCIH